MPPWRIVVPVFVDKGVGVGFVAEDTPANEMTASASASLQICMMIRWAGGVGSYRG